MKMERFVDLLVANFPTTSFPIVPLGAFPKETDPKPGLLRLTVEEGDPIIVIKAKPVDDVTKKGAIHIALILKDTYSDGDLKRAIELIKKADALE